LFFHAPVPGQQGFGPHDAHHLIQMILDAQCVFQDPRKNNFPFYPSRLQAIFARSGGVKNLQRACYSYGFATPGANKANPNPGA
jgi:hypothetical protein